MRKVRMMLPSVSLIVIAIFSPVEMHAGKISIREVLTIGHDSDGIIYQWVGLTTDDENNIYISDLKDTSIKKFDPEGRFIAKTGQKGQGPGDFLTPGVIRYHDGFLYVGQIQSPGIQIFDKNLNYRKSVPLRNLVTSFRIFGKNLIAASMLMSTRIVFFDSKGDEIRFLQYSDILDIMLNAVDFIGDDEHVYLCFKWQDKIVKYSRDGAKIWERNLLRAGKPKQKKVGDYLLPQDICFKSITVDPRNSFYYVLGGDLSKNVSRDIYVLSKDGTWVDTVTLPEPSHMIHVDEDGYLFSRAEYGTLLKKYQLIYNE
ncbi:MAG: hypothetical protein SCM96_05285 [Acidobacteriota bacterium]|nr:hypothetical protein [Acidobacteriota bacterium]